MRKHGSVVDEVAGGEVVAAVDDEVVVGEQRDGVVNVESELVQANRDERVDPKDGVARALRLGPADIGGAVDDLALQVGLVDGVEVDDAQRADTGSGQIQQRRRTQPAGADHQHASILQPLLPEDPDLRDDQVTAVAGNLVAGEFSCRGHQWRQGHGARQAIGYGQELNRQVLPSGLTYSGSNRLASLSDVEKVCCIMIGASAPLRSHGSWVV